MIYKPSEDSYLLLSILKNFVKDKKVLDIGSGSGILAEEALKSGAKSVTASDIESESISLLREKKITAINSDLFSNINDKFDLIIFNPPYLPEDKREDKASALSTTGGKNGDEIILKFLKEVKNHLAKKGSILLLLSSLTPKSRINKILARQKFKKEIIASKKIFFETLEVWKIYRE